jgi:hypothetical protein
VYVTFMAVVIEANKIRVFWFAEDLTAWTISGKMTGICAWLIDTWLGSINGFSLKYHRCCIHRSEHDSYYRVCLFVMWQVQFNGLNYSVIGLDVSGHISGSLALTYRRGCICVTWQLHKMLNSCVQLSVRTENRLNCRGSKSACVALV